MGNDRPRRQRNSFSAMPADLPDARPLQSATVPQRDATSSNNLISHLVADRLVVIAGTRNAAIGRSLKAAGARGILHLGIDAETAALEGFHAGPYEGSASVGANNCTVALLAGHSALALRSRQFFQGFETILLPLSLALVAGSAGFARYTFRRKLTYEGLTGIDGLAWPVVVFRNCLFASRPRTRIHAPARYNSKEILKSLADLDAVVLRGVEAAEAGSPVPELDVLAEGAAADQIEAGFAGEPATVPIDLYSDDGSGGRTFKLVSLFPPAMAAEMIRTAIVRPSGIKVPSDDWRFVSCAFELLFHKSDRVARGTERLDDRTFATSDDVRELRRLAKLAGAPAPTTFSDIETLLRARGVFPEIDSIGFFSADNAFLSTRYRSHAQSLAPGLAVFLVRDFGLGDQFVREVHDNLRRRGFSILYEKSVDPTRDRDAVSRMRGGNWLDPMSKSGKAPPIHVFVCFDREPQTPPARERKRYPRLDNARTLLKADLRGAAAANAGVRYLNAVHTTDNSAEAEGYIVALGIGDEPAVRDCIARLRELKRA